MATTATAALGLMLGGCLVVLGVWLAALSWIMDDEPTQRRGVQRSNGSVV